MMMSWYTLAYYHSVAMAMITCICLNWAVLLVSLFLKIKNQIIKLKNFTADVNMLKVFYWLYILSLHRSKTK